MKIELSQDEAIRVMIALENKADALIQRNRTDLAKYYDDLYLKVQAAREAGWLDEPEDEK